MKSGLKGGRADQELDEIAKSLLADESFLADDFEQMAHITTPIEAPMIPFAEFEKDGDTAKSLSETSPPSDRALFSRETMKSESAGLLLPTVRLRRQRRVLCRALRKSSLHWLWRERCRAKASFWPKPVPAPARPLHTSRPL